MTNVALILLGVVTNAGAQIMLKLGMNAIGRFDLSLSEFSVVFPKIATSFYIWCGLLSYVFSFAVWLVVLSRVDVSLAYPMISIGYIIGLFAGYWLFQEPVTFTRVFGVGVIVLGVILISQTGPKAIAK